MTEGVSLGSCLKRDAAKCPVLVDLLKRAFRVAIQGGDLAELQRNVGLVEPWQAVPLLKGEKRSEVLVTYAVDYLDPFSHRAWAPWEELLGEYGEAIEVQFLQLPHARHQGAETIALLALQAASVGRSLEFHREVWPWEKILNRML